MPRSIVILQSNYIPWKGYFDLMAAADEFVIFDEVQFTRRDWRNRNKIVLDGKLTWLTIPVKAKGNFDVPIEHVEIADSSWTRKHLASIRHAYAKAEHFWRYRSLLEKLYADAAALSKLTDINELFLRGLAHELGITTPIVRSTSLPRSATDPTGRLVEITRARGGDEYISGPSARAYIEQGQFSAAGVRLAFADYSGYPTYAQMSETFEHGVSIIDVLVHLGPAARDYLKSPRERTSFVRWAA